METEYREIDIGNAVLRVYANGEVWSYAKPVKLKLHRDIYGYWSVHTRGFRVKLHRLMLTLFDRPPKPGEVGRHLDGDRSHNTISNLAWGTHLENADDTRRHGRQAHGERQGHAKLTEEAVRDILQTKGGLGRVAALADKYQVSYGAIKAVRQGVNWRHVISSHENT